jgi:hypothetical protein
MCHKYLSTLRGFVFYYFITFHKIMMRIKDKFVTRVLTPEVSGVWGESVWCENTFGNILITVMRKNGEPTTGSPRRRFQIKTLNITFMVV